jgi:hypothetical protein
MNGKVIKFLKSITLEDRVDILNNILWHDDTFLYIFSDKRDCGFDIPLDKKAEYPSIHAGLNGLSIQISMDMDKAELSSHGKSVKISEKKWNKVKLNSFKIN